MKESCGRSVTFLRHHMTHWPEPSAAPGEQQQWLEIKLFFFNLDFLIIYLFIFLLLLTWHVWFLVELRWCCDKVTQLVWQKKFGLSDNRRFWKRCCSSWLMEWRSPGETDAVGQSLGCFYRMLKNVFYQNSNVKSSVFNH